MLAGPATRLAKRHRFRCVCAHHPHAGAPTFSKEMRNSIHPIWSERLGGYLGVAHRHLSTGWQKEGAPFMCTPLRCHSRSHAMQQPELDLTPRPSAVR